MTYRLDGVFTAIADVNRRQLLDFLMAGDMTAGSLASQFEMSRPAVVRHLRVLEQNGLVAVNKRGKYRIYSVNPAPLGVVRDWLFKYDRFWDERLAALKRQVEGEILGDPPTDEN